LRSELYYDLKIQNDYRTRRATGKRFRWERQLLCRLIEDGHNTHSVFSAGLTARTIDLLERHHVDWSMDDLRPKVLPPPKLDAMELSKIRDDQMPALSAIFANDGGVIDGPTGVGKTFLMCQVCRAYPKSRIIICTYRSDVANSIYKRLSEHVPVGALGRVGGGHKRPSRVTVATIDSLLHAKPETCRLFMYDEVHEAAAPTRAIKISKVRMARMFGFSASPEGRSDGADMVIEALFGPTIFKSTYQEAEKAGVVATIKVQALQIDGPSIPYDGDIDQFRYGIWRNDHRNSALAKEATRHLADNKQVLIVVDKVEHALQIRSKFLPAWPIVHGPVAPEQVKTFSKLGMLPQGPTWLCQPEQRDVYRDRFERGTMRCAIATGVWSQGVDFCHLDVLLRADGTSAAIGSTQIPGRLSRGSHGLLIDCNDKFDERFLRRSERRFRIYTSKGWEITDKEIRDD